ncbi:MAG: DMT family transporter [Planctomycetes bacterium]|nr:DMT family transporter [Planctomycetota bacterium]
MFTSSFTWAAYTLLSKRPLASSGPWRVTPFVLAVAGGAALVAALPGGLVADSADGSVAALSNGGASATAAPGALTSEAGAEAGVPWSATWAVVFLGLGASGAAFLCWAATIERFGALRAGLLIYLQPFVTLVLALWILDEPAGWRALVGGPIVLLGVALASRR